MNTIWAKTDFNSIGIVGSTAYGIVSKLQSVIWVVGGTIRTVLTVIVGQFIGKEKYNDLNLVMKNAIKLIIAPTIIILIFLIICSKPFCEVFSQNEDVLKEAMTFLNVATFCFVLVPLCQAICGFILGIGNTRFSFIVSLIANVVEIVLIVAINKIFTIPMIAIAIGITVWYVTYSIIGSIYYYSNKWKERQNLIALVKYTYLQVKRIQAKQVNGKSEDIDLITNLQDIIPEIEMIKGIIPLDKTAMVG
jgi:Na+-driven multidrug efflux pump